VKIFCKTSMPRKETTSEERSAIIALHEAGHSYDAISILRSKPKSTVAGVIRCARNNPAPFASAPRSSHPRTLDSKQEEALIVYAEANTHDSLNALSTPSKSGKQICKNTARTVLKHHGLSRQKARRKPYLSLEHRQQCLKWCLEHKD
jgi:transposase